MRDKLGIIIVLAILIPILLYLPKYLDSLTSHDINDRDW